MIKDHYTADPSAHVFNGKIYIYPSHDVDTGVKDNSDGDHFDMHDYHVYSMMSPTGKIKDHGGITRGRNSMGYETTLGT